MIKTITEPDYIMIKKNGEEIVLKPWYHRKVGKIYSTSIYFDKPQLYYRLSGKHELNSFVTEICLGERYAHISPGLLFHNENYIGSYIDNWHGGPIGSLSDMIRWLWEAEYPEFRYSLWMRYK